MTGRGNQDKRFFNIYITINDIHTKTGQLAQLVERRTREHNVSGLYRCGFESPAAN